MVCVVFEQALNPILISIINKSTCWYLGHIYCKVIENENQTSMKDLCIPIPHLNEKEIVEVDVTVSGQKAQYHFRVESFPWMVDDTEIKSFETEVINHHQALSLARVNKLKEAIANYDKDWELIQIYTPDENARFIQILYRKRIE